MTRVKKIALTLTLALGVAAGAAAYTPAHQLAGDPSQWGIESVAKKGSFDITEELLTSQDDDNNGDVPVVPGVASNDEKNGDVPVVPGVANASGFHIPAAVLS